MTLPASGALSIANVNTEVGAASTTNRALSWVQANTHYGYTNLNSLHGQRWFAAMSSKNSFSRTEASMTTNCAQNCTSQTNPNGYDLYGVENCVPNQTVNCAVSAYTEAYKLQKDCNCNCNCANCNCAYTNCNCACSTCDQSTCFPAGSLVLMADGSWQEISIITAGDMLWSPQGAVKCYQVDTPLLGNRRMLTMLDGSLRWSEEHRLWVKRGEKESFWSLRKDLLVLEMERGDIPFMEDALIVSGNVAQEEVFASLRGWIKNTPVFDSPAAQDTQLYLPCTGSLICINGYLVSGAADPTKYDFVNFTWKPQ